VDLPEGRKAFPSHWVYETKCDEAGNVQRFKARLVCGRNDEIEGINNQVIFAPTDHLGQVGMAGVITAKYDVEIHQMDI